MKDMPIFNLLLCAQIFDQIIRNFSLLAITVFLFPSSRSRFADSRWDVIQIHNSLVQITVEGGKAQIDYFIEVRPLRLEMLLFFLRRTLFVDLSLRPLKSIFICSRRFRLEIKWREDQIKQQQWDGFSGILVASSVIQGRILPSLGFQLS